MFRYALAIAAATVVIGPLAANAQGLVGGAERGAAEGSAAAGPIGGIVGGAVGAGVGTVNGALGIHPRYGHRCYWRHGRRHCFH